MKWQDDHHGVMNALKETSEGVPLRRLRVLAGERDKYTYLVDALGVGACQ